jgi:hypothetical protein
MDYVCSLTGKSPSTTGAGSEGALTKGPFNSLRPTADLNTALVSMILTGVPGYSTAAGHVGPNCRFDHDISYLVPEIWCRLSPEERDPANMISRNFLEPVQDITLPNGKVVPARRLGYRITTRFVHEYFGRVFDAPGSVFDEAVLKPELQDMESYVDGIQYIMEAYQRTAQAYFEDGSIAEACPPLKVLLNIMAYGHYEGRDERDPEIRRLFTRESLLASDWYQDRLKIRQRRDIALWTRHVSSLQSYLAEQESLDNGLRPQLENRLAYAQAELARVSAPEYLQSLVGTLGADPLGEQP